MRKLLTLLLFAAISIVSFAQLQDPAHWSYKVKDLPNNEAELTFIVRIDAGWHLYSQYTDPMGPIALAFEFENGPHYKLIGKVVEPRYHEEFDSTFSCKVRSFSGTCTFRQRVKKLSDKPTVVKGSLSYQMCNDGSCIPPDDKPFSFNLGPMDGEADTSAVADTAQAEDDAMDEGEDVAKVATTPDDVTDNDGDENEKSDNMLVIFLIALAGGIATMFTPCVFPMIPMTVNFFMHSSGNKRKNRRQAMIFGLSIIGLFAVLGLVLTLLFGPETLNFIATHWVPNVIFFIIFLVFSLSFFGLFEIKMPEKWINASDEQADKGGFFAPFFIALTTVLVSFSCTGPIIGGALATLATSTDNQFVSLLTMLGFGIGFALPFTLLAFFPSFLKNMKSGGWLNTVKVSFAFLELAFGLKFLSMADQYCTWHLLDREIYLALWIVIFALLGFYLLGKLSFHGDEEVKEIGVVRLFLAILDFAFVVYMIPGLWGAPLKGLSGYIPPMDTQDFNIERLVVENAGQGGSTIQFEGKLPADRKHADKLHMPTGFEGFYDLEEAKAYAKKEGKPIFIDFTGRNCANCREMEQSVWTDPAAKKLLNEEFVMVALYADMNSIDLPEEEWVTDGDRVIKTLGKRNLNYQIKKFNNNAQPYYVIMDCDENVMTKENFKYQRDASKFVEFLQEGIATYKSR